MYYFDNSATTRPSEEVLETYTTVAKEYFGNPSSAHKLGEEASSLLETARRQISQILAYRPEEIYFASCGTEVNNWVFQGILREIMFQQSQRNRVLISEVEHPATLRQIPYLKSLGYEVELIPVNQFGQIDIVQLNELITADVLLVSTMAVNNEVGTIQPLADIASILNEYPQIIWHVDAVQAVTCQLNLLKHNRIDMLSLSSHKFHGVRGVGILAKRSRVADGSLIFGGGQENNLRGGTENLPAIVAASKALRIARDQQKHTIEKLTQYKNRIVQTLLNSGWQVYGGPYTSPHIITCSYSPIPGEVLLHAFEAKDIYISTTSACSSRKNQEHATLRAMQVSQQESQSAIRISMSQDTTDMDVANLISGICQISDQFKEV